MQAVHFKSLASNSDGSVKSIGDNFCANWGCQTIAQIYLNTSGSDDIFGSSQGFFKIGNNFCYNNSCKPVRGMGLYGVTEIGTNFCGERGCSLMTLLTMTDLQTYGTGFCGGKLGLACASMESIVIGHNTGINVITYFADWKRNLLVWCSDAVAKTNCDNVVTAVGPSATIECISMV